jgi:hypothetical protein
LRLSLFGLLDEAAGKGALPRSVERFSNEPIIIVVVIIVFCASSFGSPASYPDRLAFGKREVLLMGALILDGRCS